MNKYYLLTITLLYSVLSFSQDGTLDSSFGLIYQFPGFYFKTITSYGEYNNGKANALALSSTGSIRIGATEEKRSTYSSPLVNSFGFHTVSANGTISNDNISGSGYLENCSNTIFLSNGKSLLIGSKYYDNNFVNNGDILMQFNNADGTIDTSVYPVTGQKTINIAFREDITSIKEYDNKLYACGNIIITENQTPKILVARFDLNGNLDTTFNTTGYKTLDLNGLNVCSDLSVQSDGKILLVAHSTTDPNNFIVYRLNNDSTLDTTFGTNGIKYVNLGANGNSIPNTIIIQSDHKILVSGTLNLNNSNVFNYAVARLNENGSLDTSFGSNGFYKTMVGISPSGSCTDMKLLSNGKIILAGNLKTGTGIGLLKLNSNGTLDNTFGTNGITTTVNNNITNVSVSKIAIKSDGKVLVVGGAKANAPNNQTQIFIAQYNNSNTLGNEKFKKDKSTIYPNPVKEAIYLSNITKAEYEIFNILGESISKGISNENQINVNSLTKGIYILRFKDEDVIFNQKFIKE